MKRGLQRSISPRTAAVVILLVLAAVQAWWWRAFIWRPPIKSGVSMNAMSPMPPGPDLEQGRPDVYVETIAGAVEPGLADGPGRDARFDSPAGIAIDAGDTLYVADSRNHQIRVVKPNGVTSTLAGSCEGFRDGPASEARFRFPCAVAVGKDGVVYVADTGNHCIRKVQQGVVTTLAGGRRGYAPGKGPAAAFDTPVSVAMTAAGLIVADWGNARIRRVVRDGSVDAGTPCPGPPASVTGGARWAATSPDGGVVFGEYGVLRNVTTAQGGMNLAHPGVALPLSMNEATADEWLMAPADQGAVLLVRGEVAEVLAGGCQHPGSSLGWRDFAGDQARFGRIGGMVMDSSGRLYVSDTDANSVRRITVPELVRGKERPR
jgi:hypothetical protein